MLYVKYRGDGVLFTSGLVPTSRDLCLYLKDGALCCARSACLRGPRSFRGGWSPPRRFPRRRAGTHLRRSTQVRVPAQAEIHRHAAVLVDTRRVAAAGAVGSIEQRPWRVRHWQAQVVPSRVHSMVHSMVPSMVGRWTSGLVVGVVV